MEENTKNGFEESMPEEELLSGEEGMLVEEVVEKEENRKGSLYQEEGDK